MTTIDFNIPLVERDGTTKIVGDTQGELLSKCLAAATQGNALKLWDWSKALHKGDALKLDSADVDTLTKFINDCANLTVLSKGQMLAAIKAGQPS